MNINNPTTFSTPNLTLTTANSSGSAGSLRADDSILVYDTSLPDAITYGQSGATGSASTAARRDHAHAMAAADTVAAATQAEMEAASSTSVYSSPGRAQYHPSSARAWVQYHTTTSTGIDGSYNISSLSDNGVGDTVVVIDVDFANDDFAAAALSNLAHPMDVGRSGGASIQIITENNSFARTDASRVGLIMAGAQ